MTAAPADPAHGPAAQVQRPTGNDLPRVQGRVPGPLSRAWIDRLARHECPAITARRTRRAAALGTASDDPIVWARAVGANVQDVDGNVFVDMTAGFGVAGVGHRDPHVVAALRAQAGELLHAMGDAFPDTRRIQLLERLAALTQLDRSILGSSGSDAVEAALKTARQATGRDGVLAFSGSYHGLSYGALAVTAYKREAFAAPFVGQLGQHVRFLPYGQSLPDADADLWRQIGAVIVEPIQGRGGICVPPPGWLQALADRARAGGAVLIFDEIYTGFGRTGSWFAFQRAGAGGRPLVPDLLCVGKSMAGGFPISACIGTAATMDAWGASQGEALHTQTFLGNPVGCAMALACIDRLAALVPEVDTLGAWLTDQLQQLGLTVRGRGLMLAIALGPHHPDSLSLSRVLLQHGYLALPAGEGLDALALCPPLGIHPRQLSGFVEALTACLRPAAGATAAPDSAEPPP